MNARHTSFTRPRRATAFSDAILNAVGAAIAVLDTDGRIQLFNRFAESITGYREADLLGKPIWQHLIPKHSANEVKRVFEDLKLNRFTGTFENEWITRDGRPRLFLWNNTVLRSESGEITHVIAIGNDITDQRLAEKAERDQRALIESIINNIPTRIFWKDKDLHFLGCNQAFADDAQKSSPSEIIGKNDYDMIWAAQAHLYRLDDNKIMHTGTPQLAYEEPQATPQNSLRWLRTSKLPLKDQCGDIIGILGIYEDITQEKAVADALKKNHDRMSLLLDSTHDGIFGVDRQGTCTFANRSFLSMHGFEREGDVVGKNIHESLAQAHFDGARAPRSYRLAARSYEDGQPVQVTDEISYRCDGKPLFVEYSAHPLRENERLIGAVVTVRDITEKKATASRLEHLAYHDPLTGLPNRLMLLDRLSQSMARSVECASFGAVVFIDIDNFKNINDVFGHEVGDRILCDVANSLKANLGDADILARFGGDEFVAVLDDLGPDVDAARRRTNSTLNDLHQCLARQRFGDDCNVAVTASFGIAVFPERSISATEFIRRADIAMYRAKKHGRNTSIFFEREMQEEISERFALEQDLRQAVQSKQFKVFLQAKVDRSGKVIGAEALLRWQHPTRGLLLPSAFIELAEEIGVLDSISDATLREVCRVVPNLLQFEESISINISPRQFLGAGFSSFMKKIVSEMGCLPSRLMLEVTENSFIDRAGEAENVIRDLAGSGFRFSIDDFGTGYSSLNYIKRLPFTEIKIDRTFVKDLVENKNDQSIALAIISLAHHLGLSVVAEGVETQEQFNFLREAGCDYFQGFLFHRPEYCDAWISARRAAAGTFLHQRQTDTSRP